MALIQHFQRARKPLLREISVSANQVITFGTIIAAEHCLRNGSYVLLYFDTDTKQIAIKPLRSYADGAAKISDFGNRLHISARMFCEQNNIATGRYLAIWDAKRELIICTKQEST